jgi:hypothetical protein
MRTTSQAGAQTRAWVRRTYRRRASDRRFRLETILAACGLVAWAWCGYQLFLTFSH